MKDKFIQTIKEGYTFKGESFPIGVAMFEGEALPEAQVKIPLKTLNRHGLIAGATGTGKTKTLQVLAENMSEKSISVVMMDIKGDLSGIAAPGSMNPKIEERQSKTGIAWTPKGFPVELLSLSKEPGVRLRATVSEFGPVLMGKILGLNDTQQGVLSIIYKYCDDRQLPLLDLKDLKKTLQYLTGDGKADIEKDYGLISTSTAGAILRGIVELEQQGAELFFGEKSFEVSDLCRLDENGNGVISIIRLTDIQDKPKLFSTFMLQMLAEIYASFPEVGDKEAPSLVIFIDEAHLIFDEASKALLDQIETIIKLIRSKGVGIFFCTQIPGDVPDNVLSQLGLKVQHALRAFTAKDRKEIEKTAENYPLTDFYKVDELITQLGIGEAFVTTLNEKGIPTPLAATMLCPPRSRMDILSAMEMDGLMAKSRLAAKYNTAIDRESAYELLNAKIAEAEAASKEAEEQKQQEAQAKKNQGSSRREKTVVEKVVNSGVGKTVVRELTRGLLGVLGLGGSTRRRRSLF